MQKIILTPQEREVILDYASRLEKRSRYWHVLRWLALVCFVFGLSLFFVVGRLGTEIGTTLELPAEALKFSESSGSKAFENSFGMIVAHGEEQVVSLRAEFYSVLKALIVAGVGTAMFLYVVSEWRRDRRDRLVSRLLRSFLSFDAGDKET